MQHVRAMRAVSTDRQHKPAVRGRRHDWQHRLAMRRKQSNQLGAIGAGRSVQGSMAI